MDQDEEDDKTSYKGVVLWVKQTLHKSDGHAVLTRKS